MDYRNIDRVEKEKIKRNAKIVKQCKNCGKYKNLSNGETVEYTKDRDLKTVVVCDVHCKKSFIKREIDDLLNKVEWLKAEIK